MVAGHFGLAAGVKARERAVPLWALMLATQWLDVVFVPLFIAKIETIEVIGGGKPGYGNGIIHANYTHSLVGALVLALVFALPAGLRWGRRAAVVLGAVVFSHWLIDLLVHHHDMPLFPGAPAGWPLFGFGLWRWPVVTAAATTVRSCASPPTVTWRSRCRTPRGPGASSCAWSTPRTRWWRAARRWSGQAAPGARRSIWRSRARRPVR